MQPEDWICSDVAFIASHVFFGNCPRPPAVESSAWATTKYRVPDIVYRIASQRATVGSYEIRQRVDTVDPKLDAYFYMRPHYSLACFQNAKSFNCQYYGSTHRANLGPAIEESIGNRKFCFYNIQTENSSVFVAIIFYPDQEAGVLEFCLAEEFGSWSDFTTKIRNADGTCDMEHRMLSHTNLCGDRIVYDNGKATVNEEQENKPARGGPARRFFRPVDGSFPGKP